MSVCYPETVHSLTRKRWLIRQDFRPLLTSGDDRENAQTLLSLLRRTRGINEHDGEMETIVLPDMPVVVERIRKAIGNREKIGIFGDYDCDGITAVTQLARYFHRRHTEPLIRLPHRVRDGYGLKSDAIQAFHAAGIHLLITMDTGVSSLAEIALARNLGMDVIIVDHHHIPPVLPEATAILHPALASNPGAHPSAAGLAYQLVEELELAEGNHTWEGQDIDIALAATGTIADLVELRGTNRLLVQRGLLALSRSNGHPLAILRNQAGIGSAITSRDIAFRIAPRINAAGRMEDPSIALAALMGDAAALSRLELLNQDRQLQTQTLVQSIVEEASKDPSPFLFYVSEHIPPGIMGLIAGKLTEQCGKPSLVGSCANGRCSASLRSIPEFNVTTALTACKDLLLSYGGHAQAAGCTFEEGKTVQLREALNAQAALLPAELLSPSVIADGVLDYTHITMLLCETTALLEPFGQGNPEPRFVLEGATLSAVRCVGKDSTHLQATVESLKAIAFSLGHLLEHTKQPLDILCRISIDEWQGRKRPQLLIEDLRVHSSKHIEVGSTK